MHTSDAFNLRLKETDSAFIQTSSLPERGRRKTFHSKQLRKICGGVSHGPYQDSTFARSDMYEAERTEGGHHINTLSA